MDSTILAPDRVLLLLSLVPYLREHGPTSATDLAETFDVSPAMLRSLVEFLGTAGVPGETMTYQDEDLFDIDWDALESDDVVSLTRTVAVDDAPRFAPAETAALMAGLQALTPVLPVEYVELAMATAQKLASALGQHEHSTTLSITADPEDPRIPSIVQAIAEGNALKFTYQDAAGAKTARLVDPISLQQSTGTWYLRAHCHDRNAERTFRLDQVRSLEVAGPVSMDRVAEVSASENDFDLFAWVSDDVLPQLQGFAPEPVRDDQHGRLLVRIRAWHTQTAIQLVQRAPGSITIDRPESARAAVQMWAERALSGYDA